MASSTMVYALPLTRKGLGQVIQHCRRSLFTPSTRLLAASEKDSSDQTHTQRQERDREEGRGDSEQEDHDSRQQILRASLPFVHQHGWSNKAIAAGADSLGLPAVVTGMFGRGGGELVLFFYDDCNQRLVHSLEQQVQKHTESKPPTAEFIRGAAEERLRMLQPYLSTWPQAMAILALPPNAPEALKLLGQLVDHIWYYAGDRSVDFNWYTKRALLAAAYKSSELYMLQDKSEDNADTWAFLQRRIDDLQSAGSAVRKTSQLGDAMMQGLSGLSIVGRNLLGMNSRNR